MKDVGFVYGSKEQATPLVYAKDTVYVHTNITKIEQDSQGNVIDNLYRYYEIQYTHEEYSKVLAEKNVELEDKVLNSQLAIAELVEGGLL